MLFAWQKLGLKTWIVHWVSYTKFFQQSKEQRFKVFDNRIELILYIKDDDFSEFSPPHCYV